MVFVFVLNPRGGGTGRIWSEIDWFIGQMWNGGGYCIAFQLSEIVVFFRLVEWVHYRFNQLLLWFDRDCWKNKFWQAGYVENKIINKYVCRCLGAMTNVLINMISCILRMLPTFPIAETITSKCIRMSFMILVADFFFRYIRVLWIEK